MQETQVQSLVQEYPLEKGMATHSNILAWRIPWSEDPGRLQSMGSQNSWTLLSAHTHTHTQVKFQNQHSNQMLLSLNPVHDSPSSQLTPNQVCISDLYPPHFLGSESVNHSMESDSFVTPWTVAHQASLSMGFSRQVYWSGLPLLSPGDLPDPGIKPVSPALAGRFFTV